MTNIVVNPGVYETLISQAIEEKLKDYPESQYLVKKEGIDSAESYKMLAEYLTEIVSGFLKNYFRCKDARETISAQVDVVNRILKFIEQEWKLEGIETSSDLISDENKQVFLRGIYSRVGLTKEQVEAKAKNHPVSGYRVSNLFTGGHDLSLDDEVRRDIQTADEIDLVVSFIKFEGLRLLVDDLREFVERPGTRLRVLTTTYMGLQTLKLCVCFMDCASWEMWRFVLRLIPTKNACMQRRIYLRARVVLTQLI